MRRTSPELRQRLSSLECVLFDLDGTLIDTMHLILTSFQHATTQVLGAPLPDAVLMRNVGVPLRVQMSEFAPGQAEELLLAYREHNDRVHDDLIKEYPGTIEALIALKAAGLTLGIVTSKSRRPAERGLASFELEEYFDFVLTSDDCEAHKPSGEPLRVAAAALGHLPEECAYVGDSPHDMAAALDAEMLAIAALWGGFEEDEVCEPGPDFACNDIAAVVCLLAGDEETFQACLRNSEPCAALE